MKNSLSIGSVLISATISIIVGAESATMSLADPPCEVNDPTGTPLNLRSRPNGRIIARIKNNTTVEQTNTPTRGRWQEIRVRVGGKPVVGWIFRAYLACQ